MSDKQIIESSEYKEFLKFIKERIYKAQYEGLKQVNKELINLYWDIGKKIIEKQEILGWGKSVVNNLAKDLQNEFPGMMGYSSSNLWRMRNFYINYRGEEKLAPLVREISWTKNVIIMEKCKDRTVVEYALKKATNPIGVSTYQISKKLPKEIQKYLPSPEEISKEVSAFLQRSSDEKNGN